MVFASGRSCPAVVCGIDGKQKKIILCALSGSAVNYYHVTKVLKDFGERVQFSVFEANLQPEQVEQLKRRVTECLDHEEDSLRIYAICASCTSRIEILGQGVVTQDPDIIII